MRPTPLFLGICAGIAVSGSMAGLTLGGYATGERSGAAVAYSPQDMALSSDPGDSYAAPGAIAARVDDHPESYKCRGCGPSLAERRMLAYTSDYDRQYAGLDADYAVPDRDVDRIPADAPPPYRPIPFEQAASPPDEPAPL